MNLYPEMNDKIADLLGMSDEPMYLYASEYIKQLRAELAANQWIPVSERLPEEPYGCLLVVEEDDYYGEPHKVLLPYFAGYDGDGWNDGDGQRIPFEVTHWMPLPEAPGKE